MPTASSPVPGRETTEPHATKTGSVTGSRKPWFAVGALALVAGLVLNWGWLVAAGIAPLLLLFLPCAVMCGLSLCTMNCSPGGCKGGNTEQVPAALDATRT